MPAQSRPTARRSVVRKIQRRILQWCSGHPAAQPGRMRQQSSSLRAAVPTVRTVPHGEPPFDNCGEHVALTTSANESGSLAPWQPGLHGWNRTTERPCVEAPGRSCTRNLAQQNVELSCPRASRKAPLSAKRLRGAGLATRTAAWAVHRCGSHPETTRTASPQREAAAAVSA